MPDLCFSVKSIVAGPDLAESMLYFRVQIENAVPDEQIQSISLNAQVQIQPARRRYNSEEKIALRELFDEPARWATTLRPVFWAKASVTAPSFQGSTTVSLPVSTSSGLDDAAGRYCQALQEGDIPIELLFSGTIFYVSSGAMQVAFIPWSKESFCRMPLAVWREVAPLHSDAGSADSPRERSWEQILEYARTLAGRNKP